MDVRAERQDLREIAALVIDLDDRERRDTGCNCARQLPEAHRGEVHRAADHSIANGTINQDIIGRLLDLVRFRIGSIKPAEKFMGASLTD